jgi:predicted transcriptional regulator
MRSVEIKCSGTLYRSGKLCYNSEQPNVTGAQLMTVVINLTPELEKQLRKRATDQGQDVSLVITELLADVLEWESQDLEEAVIGIQRGLDDFEAGNFRSFDEFADEQRRKYNLPA